MAVSHTSSGVTLVVSLVSASALWAAEPPNAPIGIGRPLAAQEVTADDLTILPDGAGLQPGRGTAKKGALLYTAQCAPCHADHGEGRSNFPALVGGRGSLSTDKPVLTVGSYWPYATTVWDYINRAMPYQNPGSLRADEVYALTAYVLFLNGIVGESEVLDRVRLPRIRMPNRDGFVEDQRPGVRLPSDLRKSTVTTEWLQ